MPSSPRYVPRVYASLGNGGSATLVVDVQYQFSTTPFAATSVSEMEPAATLALGPIVRSLSPSAGSAPGTHTARWDGTQDDGRAAAPWVYFVRLVQGEETRTRAIVLER